MNSPDNLEAQGLPMAPPGRACCLGGESGAALFASTTLTFKDRLGALKVRWGIGRMNYKVKPGLYSVGQPDAASPVLVSANYKLTFDSLRKELAGIDSWLLVLDTRGINVWCAAGKGVFGTAELVGRINSVGLGKVVSHRRLILPQLGAVGVDAREVLRQSGFSVHYGPVRAADIKVYLSEGKASPAMRAVRFNALDRLVLTPVELVAAVKKSLPFFGLLFLLNLFAARPFGPVDAALYAGAVITGTVITPLLLPFVPGRAFAWKGWLLGLAWTSSALTYSGWLTDESRLLAAGYLLALPALSAWLTMNFTGSSTYTSFSGVNKEMRTAIPLLAFSGALGLGMLLVKTFGG